MIILATQSKARRKLFKKCVRNAVFRVSKIDETRFDNESVVEYLLRVSFLKAREFYKKGVISIGADTIVVFDDEVIGKPKNISEAFEILKKLSGHYHRCLTGVSVIREEGCVSFVDEAVVFMEKLSDKEIMDYVRTGEFEGRAAGYAIQGRASAFMRVVKGDKTTVIGLPMKKLCRII